jgi:hypothetical protein
MNPWIMCLGVISLLACATPAFAWDSGGHMLVADLAWLYMSGSVATVAAVKGILNKAKSGFAPQTSSDVDVRDAFDWAATFPDFLKNNLHSDYQPFVDQLNTYFWPGGVIDPHVNFRERVQCKTWHYYDTPINYTGTPPVVHPSNLQVAYAEAVLRLTELKSGQNNNPATAHADPDDLRFWWLGWLLHLAGDAHQPLHCVSNYAFNPNGDAGGNGFQLSSHLNLHSFWDGCLIDAAKTEGFAVGSVENEFDPSVRLAAVSDAWKDTATTGSANESRVEKWVEEGADNARTTAYVGVTQGHAPSAAYRTTAQLLCKKVAVLAGLRLANALISIFG